MTKFRNFDYDLMGVKRKLQLNELDEWRLVSYGNMRFYKEKVKGYHDRVMKQDKKFVQDD